MKIKFAGDIKQKDLPSERDISEILEIICHKCNFDLDRITFKCSGGRRKNTFSHIGAKLLRIHNFSVQMYIGCINEAVEGNLFVTDKNNIGMNGNRIHEIMSDMFNGKIFLVDEEDIKNLRTLKNGNEHTEEESEHSDIMTEAIVVPEQEQSVQVVQDTESTSETTFKQEQAIVYKRYFDDPKNLHLATCSLVLACNQNKEYVFSFGTFEQALQDAGVQVENRVTGPLIRPFLLRNFIKRINPDTKPPRYQITQAAIDFANAEIPTEIVKAKKPIHHKQDIHVDVTNTRETLISLKSMSDKHKAIMDKLTEAESKLKELKSNNFEEEESKIEGELVNLRRRMEELETHRQELQKKREEISSTEEEIQELNKQANDPRAMEVLRQFEEMRKLLS